MQLNEVVVVGYGTQVKHDMSSAAAEVKAADLADKPVDNFASVTAGQFSNGNIDTGAVDGLEVYRRMPFICQFQTVWSQPIHSYRTAPYRLPSRQCKNQHFGLRSHSTIQVDKSGGEDLVLKPTVIEPIRRRDSLSIW